MKEKYRKRIIEIIKETEDEKFLKKIYTIIMCHNRKGNAIRGFN